MSPSHDTGTKRVAILSFDWDYEIVSQYYRGMESYVNEVGGLQVVIFSAFGHYHKKFKADAGAFKLFDLCDLSRYDGLVTHLDNLYVHDELTGLYNRFGLERFGADTYERLLRDTGCAQFIFVDVDNMRGIYDGLGHEQGDCALRDTADVIRRASLGEDAFSMRYGGDEFLLISARDLTPQLESALALLKNSAERPYELSLSIGAVEATAAARLSMDEAIALADDKMYHIKRQRKVRRG